MRVLPINKYMDAGGKKQEALIELCKHKKAIYTMFEGKIKELEHLCWKYNKLEDQRTYDRLVETKKIYNCLKYILHDCE